MIKSNDRSIRSFANPISFNGDRNRKKKGSFFCFGTRWGVANSNISAHNDNKRQRIIRFAGCFVLLFAIQMINSVRTIFYIAPTNGTDDVRSTSSTGGRTKTTQVENIPLSQVDLLPVVKTSQSIENSSSYDADVRRRTSDSTLEQPASIEFIEESKMDNAIDVNDLEEKLENYLIVEDSNADDETSEKDKVNEEFEADGQSKDHPEPEAIDNSVIDEEGIIEEGTDIDESTNIESTTDVVDEPSYTEVSTDTGSNNSDISSVIDATTATNDVSTEKEETEETENEEIGSIGDLQSEDRPEPEETGITEAVIDATTDTNDVSTEKEETDSIADMQSEDRPEPEETGITGMDEIVEKSDFKVDREEAPESIESTNMESTTTGSTVDKTSNEEVSTFSKSNNKKVSPVLDATTTKTDVNTEIEDNSDSMGGIAISENDTGALTDNSNSSSSVPAQRLMTIEQILKSNNINVANAASKLRTPTLVEKELQTTNKHVTTVSNDTATNEEGEPIENDDGVDDEENGSGNPDRKAIETFVQPNDYIYRKGRTWDGPPVVLEEFKLIFFTSAKVGCSVWKTLFRRMMHYEDWRVFGKNGIPWNPKTNGLTYLYDYDLQIASEMMTSPEWTRAMFVRDPKERFVSAYLDKVVGHPAYMYAQCCRKKKVKVEKIINKVPSSQFYMHALNETAHERFLRQRKELQQHWNPSNIKNPPDLNAVPVVEVKKPQNKTNDNCANRSVLKLAEGSPQAFLKRVMSWCDNSHWRRQSQRVEDKYWPYINFVGYMNQASEDAERLLRLVGAWEDFGASGWTSSESITEGGPVFAKKQSQGRRHATFASEKLKTYITSYGFERALERHYAEDYAHPILNFTLHRIFESPNNNTSIMSLKARTMYDLIQSTKLRQNITNSIQKASVPSKLSL